MEWKQSTAISVGDIIYAIMEFFHEKIYVQRQGLAIFPYFTNSIWHNFLYHLRKKLGHKFPELITVIGEFDWDGPFLENRKAKDVLPMLFSTCCAIIPYPSWHVIFWSKLSNPLKENPEYAELYNAIMLEAEKYQGIISVHPLSF